MKKGFLAAMAVLMIGTAASAQTITIYGQDDNVLSTYQKGEVKRIVFNPTGEPGGPDTPDIPDTREAVDLGLSVKWASMNIGAESPSDYGDYFAWGETEPKAYFSTENAKWWKFPYSGLEYQGVIDANGNLTPEYDAATVNWGSRWRMPTKEEIQELWDKCTWTKTILNGISCYRFTGPTGNSIFFPAAGFIDNKGIQQHHSYAFYCWSSTAAADEERASAIGIYSDIYITITRSQDRFYGLNVRPVKE